MKRWIFLLLLPLKSMAQQDCDSLKFEMIKETVNFLAGDPKVSSAADFKVHCSKPSFSCLEISIGKRKLPGLLTKVQKWDAKKKGNTTEDIVSLKNMIWTDILENPSKSYRRNLKSFPAYVAVFNKLVNEAGRSSKKLNAENSKSAKPSVKLKPDTGRKDTELSEDPLSDTDTEPERRSGTSKQNELTEQTTMPNHLTIIAMAASLVAIFISFLSLKRPSVKPQKKFTPADNPVSLENQKLARLQEEVKRCQQMLERYVAEIGHIQRRLSEMEQQRERVFTFDVKALRPVEKQTEVKASEGTSTSDMNVKCYAKFSDLEGGGFSAQILKDVQNGEQTFEIEISGEEALFYVSQDPRAQKYASQNYEYLQSICSIKNQPRENGKIETINAGKLTRSGEGNWMLAARAIIEFV